MALLRPRAPWPKTATGSLSDLEPLPLLVDVIKRVAREAVGMPAAVRSPERSAQRSGSVGRFRAGGMKVATASPSFFAPGTELQSVLTQVLISSDIKARSSFVRISRSLIIKASPEPFRALLRG